MNDIFSLKGKNAVVIGGAGGIGQAIATGLAFYGAKVGIASRKLDGLNKAAKEIKDETGKDVKVFQVDSADEESIKNLVKATVADLGRIDILVNSQGLNKKYPAAEFPMNEWDDVYKVNVRGVMLCCREFGKEMVKQKYGRIINVSSIRGERAIKGGMGNSCYGSTKGAVNMLTRFLAAEYGEHNVTVNAIAPTLTKTPMMAPFLAKDPPEVQARLVAGIPLGRLGLPEDCIGPVVFLASEAGSFFTGQILYPDGGQSILA